MSTVLVTGASGFIGSHLSQTLVQHGFHVRCLVRNARHADQVQEGGFEPVLGDVTDFEAMRRAVEGVEIVFNLAGLTHARHPSELVRVNQSGPGNVARACAEQPTPPCHVLVSSVAASGPCSPDHVRLESEPPTPVSNYGRSKLLGEEAARQWAHAVPTTIVRPGIVFGPRDPGMAPVMQSVVRFRLHASPGWRSPKLSFIEVSDLNEILRRAAEQGERLPAEKYGPAASGDVPAGLGIYFGVAPEHLRYSELGPIFASVLVPSKRVLTLNVPPAIAWIVGGVSQSAAQLRGKSDLLNIDKIREALVPSWACSAAKVQEQLEFRPARTLTEQLEETARWQQRQWSHGWGYSSGARRS
jgi:nucleoside-diphosphate-sugar epimerase